MTRPRIRSPVEEPTPSNPVANQFHDHFSSFAGRYADFRPHYPDELFDHLATVAPRLSMAWDCAAGNGQATVGLAKHFEQVIGTDASREQIASAKPHPRIEFRVAPAGQSGLADLPMAISIYFVNRHMGGSPRSCFRSKQVTCRSITRGISYSLVQTAGAS